MRANDARVRRGASGSPSCGGARSGDWADTARRLHRRSNRGRASGSSQRAQGRTRAVLHARQGIARALPVGGGGIAEGSSLSSSSRSRTRARTRRDGLTCRGSDREQTLEPSGGSRTVRLRSARRRGRVSRTMCALSNSGLEPPPFRHGDRNERAQGGFLGRWNWAASSAPAALVRSTRYARTRRWTRPLASSATPLRGGCRSPPRSGGLQRRHAHGPP